jgi:hypothetical protein
MNPSNVDTVFIAGKVEVARQPGRRRARVLRLVQEARDGVVRDPASR